MKISPRSIEEVREAANIVEVASEFTALKRQGTNYTGLCPYHQEKSPSFSVSPEKNFYYCFGCLEPNERIWTARGLIPIGEIEIGDKVIGLDGRWEIVTDKEIKTGSTLRIGTGAAKEGIELTPDHWCVFVRKNEAVRAISGLHYRSKEDERLRLSGRLRNRVAGAKLSVDHASSIRPGDFWLYPVVPDEDRADAPLIGKHVIKTYTKGPRTERTTKLHVNTSTAWLYGIWLAEGSLYRGGVKWSFGAHESETLAAKVSQILEEEFGKPSTIKIRPDKNNCEVTCSSTDLAALFGYWFGCGCENKRVPIEALSWTATCQTALIEGYADGDDHTRDGVTATTTVSEELAYGIFALCVQARKVCSINSIPARISKDGVRHRKTYSVFVLSKESTKGFFAPIDGTTYYWSIVQKAETCREEPTTVIDITTTGSHTFLTKMGITHNCQKGGDAIKLVMELKSFSFVEAVSHLAERFGIELKFEGHLPGEERAAAQRTARRRSAYKALAAATAYYHKYLLKSPAAEEARHYLESRGFMQSTIEEFRLGYAPPRGRPGFMQAARRVDLDHEALEAAGLLSQRGGERFVDRLMFPISDRRGRIVGFGARALGDAKPKYLNSPETEIFNKRSLLYGFPQVAEAVRREKAALIVEGYTDVLMLYQSGIKNAVATLGTAMTEQHLKTLSGHADRIYLLFDPDEAGEKAVEKAAVTAAELKLDLRVLRLPEDPADWLLEHAPGEFLDLLSRAIPVLEYGIQRIAGRVRGAGATSRARAVPEVKALVRQIEDPVLNREALRIAAEALGVNPEALREETGPPNEASRPSSRRPRRAPSNPLTEAGRELLAIVLAHPDLASRALREGMAAPDSLNEPVVLGTGDFVDEAHARIFALLVEHTEDPGAVLSDERARPLMDEISALRAAGERLYPSEASLRAAWFRFAALSREKAKLLTDDFDEKYRLHAETKRLNAAAVEASNLTLES